MREDVIEIAIYFPVCKISVLKSPTMTDVLRSEFITSVVSNRFVENNVCALGGVFGR